MKNNNDTTNAIVNTKIDNSFNNDILGIHHVTAIASDPQKNIDFYTQILGLRLVKRTPTDALQVALVFFSS
jgi:predicted enzyme related to lactoylglutathione lyase